MRRALWLLLAATPLACGPRVDADVDRAGALTITVRDGDGALLPALVTIRGLDGTGWAVYSTTGSLSEVAPRVFGMVDSLALLDGAATVPVPPGRWRLTVSHGPTHEISAQDLEIPAGGSLPPLAVVLARAVDTTGFLSADLHVHAVRSPDSTSPLDGRVAAAAVTGLHVLGSADHNTETDYAPAIAALGLQARVASLVGNEVSLDWAHFSVFPLPFRPEEALGGALPLDTLRENLPTPAAVFAYGHGQPTQSVVQVNHPRFENPPSYFATAGLDPVTCIGAAPFTYDFDVVEVLNGIAVREPYLSSVMADWLCLVGSGHPVTATGNSDSHGLGNLSPGWPRTWVRTGDDDASTWDEGRFMQALREHRAVVSTAPFVTITAGEARIGDTASATDGTLAVRVVVQAPSWVPVDRVRLVVGGVVARELEVPAAGRPRLDEVVEVAAPVDTFVIAVAYADALLRRDVVGNIDLPPFAFTNPIFVDADGDGVFTPGRPPPAGARRAVMPPLRAFEGGHRNDDCGYELERPP